MVNSKSRKKTLEPRAQILDAANRTITRLGLNGATIDQIAAEANLTKGGVLYYFSNKEDIISAAIARQDELLMARRDAILATLPDKQRGVLRASVMSILEFLDDPFVDSHSVVGLLGVPVYRNALATVVRRFFLNLSKPPMDKALVGTILCILNGMWIDKIFSASVVPPSLHKKAVKELMDLVETCERSCEAAGDPP